MRRSDWGAVTSGRPSVQDGERHAIVARAGPGALTQPQTETGADQAWMSSRLPVMRFSASMVRRLARKA